jgi:hypothetical protein
MGCRAGLTVCGEPCVIVCCSSSCRIEQAIHVCTIAFGMFAWHDHCSYSQLVCYACYLLCHLPLRTTAPRKRGLLIMASS